MLDSGESNATGTPAFLTQADILQSIGPKLSARSDTFSIRAYGEVKDNAGRVVARSVCEAVVQRVPEYVDSSNDPYVEDIDDRMGRRFEIVDFRWLAPTEI